MQTSHWRRWLLAILAFWVLPGCGAAMLDDEAPFKAAPQADAAPCTANEARRQEHWNAFRARFPYHAQTIAVSRPFGDGCRTLIVAEPPPHATLENLVEASGVKGLEFTKLKHRIGHDGWVADAVTVLPPLGEEDLAAVISELSRSLFGTSYKAYATPIEGPATKGGVTLDLHVSPAEIERWIFDPAARFQPVAGGQRSTLGEVTADESGVYFVSSQPIVAWVIPRGADLSGLAAEARAFALDSDVLFGAVATRNAVLVLARERSVSVDVLPPLRFETLVLLAAAREDELAQSYERNHVLAGRLAPGKDWAPIYLSPALVDTEYGSLLDITDQLLKSWSNLGQTTYEGFDYPRPRSWPFDAPAPTELKTDELVYNWNTQGLGAVFVGEGHAVYAVRGTAAHSVMYAPKGRPAAAVHALESRAYAWFSGLDDANLARTVQYTIFYQIAHNLGVRATYAPSEDADQDGVEALEASTFGLLKKLREATPQTARAAMDRSASVLPELSEANRQRLKVNALISIAESHELLDGASDTALRRMAKILGSPRETQARLSAAIAGGAVSSTDVIDILLSRIARQISDQQMFLQGITDLAQVKDAYVAATSRRASLWIHTPSVVVSSNHGKMSDAIGGHNIDSRVSRFVLGPGPSSPDLPVIHPEDLPRVVFSPQGAPTLGPTPTPLRPPSVALHVERPEDDRRDRGFSPGDDGRIAAGWDAAAAHPSGGCGEGCVRVSAVGHGLLVEAGGRAYRTHDPNGTTHLLTEILKGAPSGTDVRVDFQGFSRKDARNLIRTARASLRFEATYHEKQADVEGAFRTSYDFSRAEIDPAQVKELPPANPKDENSSEIAVQIKVPSGEANEPGGRIWVRGVFAAVVPDRVRELFDEAVRKATSRPAGPEELKRRLRREMRARGVAYDMLEVDFRDASVFGDWGTTRRDPKANGEHTG